MVARYIQGVAKVVNSREQRLIRLNGVVVDLGSYRALLDSLLSELLLEVTGDFFLHVLDYRRNELL